MLASIQIFLYVMTSSTFMDDETNIAMRGRAQLEVRNNETLANFGVEAGGTDQESSGAGRARHQTSQIGMNSS